MNLKDLTPNQQNKIFIFDRWGAFDTATETYLCGIDSKGDIKLLFKMPKVAIP